MKTETLRDRRLQLLRDYCVAFLSRNDGILRIERRSEFYVIYDMSNHAIGTADAVDIYFDVDTEQPPNRIVDWAKQNVGRNKPTNYADYCNELNQKQTRTVWKYSKYSLSLDKEQLFCNDIDENVCYGVFEVIEILRSINGFYGKQHGIHYIVTGKQKNGIFHNSILKLDKVKK